MTQSSTVSTTHTYRTSFYTRHLLGAGGLSFFCLLLLLLTATALFVQPPQLSDWKMALILGFVGILCLVMAIMGPYGDSQTSLITSPEGIEYRGFGFRVFASWENVERLDVISPGQYTLGPTQAAMAKTIQEKLPLVKKLEQQFPESHFECLVLRKSLRFEKKQWARRMIRNETQYIPFTDFLRWRNGALGKDIQRYAPHLFKVDQG